MPLIQRPLTSHERSQAAHQISIDIVSTCCELFTAMVGWRGVGRFFTKDILYPKRWQGTGPKGRLN